MVYRIYYQKDKNGSQRKCAGLVKDRAEFMALRNSQANLENLERARKGDEKAKRSLVQMAYNLGYAEGPIAGMKSIGSNFFHDVDVYDKAQSEAIKELILSKKDEIGLLMLERSASGGWHLVCRRKPGTTILENQVRVATILQLEMDTSAKDLQRVVFSTSGSEEDLLYLDDAIFTEPMTKEECVKEYNALKVRVMKKQEEVPEGAKHPNKHFRPWEDEGKQNQADPDPDSPPALPKGREQNVVKSSKPNAASQPQTPSQTQTAPSLKGGRGESLLYHGIPFSVIISKYWEINNHGFLPTKGDRDTLTYQLACDLRHICGKDFDWLDAVIPCYDGFPLEEKRQKIRNALNSPLEGFPPRLRNTLNALEREAESGPQGQRGGLGVSGKTANHISRLAGGGAGMSGWAGAAGMSAGAGAAGMSGGAGWAGMSGLAGAAGMSGGAGAAGMSGWAGAFGDGRGGQGESASGAIGARGVVSGSPANNASGASGDSGDSDPSLAAALNAQLSAMNNQLASWGERIAALFEDFPLLRDICKGLKPNQYPAALFVGGGLLMTLMTRCSYRFYHRPEELRRLNNSTLIIGDPACGKSFATRLYKLLTGPIVEADKVGKDAINAYRELMRTKGSNKEKPKKPQVVVRIHPARTSNAQFIQDMVNAVEVVDGKPMQLHMLTFDTELDNTMTVQKGGSWIDKQSLELKAFHNEEDGQAYSNIDSILQNFNVVWNYIYTGTPIALKKKVNATNFGSGLATRLTCIPLPSTNFEMLAREEDIDTASDERLKEWAAKLDKTKGELSLQRIVDELYAWTERRMDDARDNDSKADEMLLKRCAYHGINFSAPFIVMRHWEELQKDGDYYCGTFETDDTDWQLAELIVNMQFACQRYFFGGLANDYFDNKLKEASMTTRPQQRTIEAFNRLPEEFTTDDIMRCFGLNNSSSARTRVLRLFKDHAIEKIGEIKNGKVTMAVYKKTGTYL